MALKDAQKQLDGRGQNYLTFSITDPVEGSLTFYLGDISYSATNAYGGAPVSACVVSWGNLVKYLPQGSERQNQAVIRLAMDSYAIPTNVAAKRYTVRYLLQNMDIRDVVVSVYQWNAGDSSQETVWKGYWGGVVGYSFGPDGSTVDISLSSLERDSTDTVADVITRSAFPNAPDGAIGLISPRGYGSRMTTTDSANEDANKVLNPIILGYGHGAGETVPIDESVSAGVTPGTRYRAAQNDGVATAKTSVAIIDIEAVNPIDGTFHIYDPTIGAYAEINSATDSVLGSDNNTSQVYIDIGNAPTVYFSLRPVRKDSSSSAGITDPEDPIDDDASNFLTLTETNSVIAWECPQISLPQGARIVDLRVVFEIEKNGGTLGNGIAIGLWNPYASGGANWWGGANYYYNTGTLTFDTGKRYQYITRGTATTGGVFGVWTVTQAAVSSTESEFSRGQFVGIDSGASNERKPLLVRMQWNATPAGGLEMKVYSVALLVKMVYPKVKTGSRDITRKRRSIFDFEVPEHLVGREDVFGVPNDAPGLKVMFTGEYQKDDGSGTITGTASALIEKAPDIARHLVQVIGGKSVNSTSGTLGNFVDARTEGTAGDRVISPVFGPSEVFTRSGALSHLMERFPWLRVYQEDGVYQCLIDHLNPHSSQVYRSTSDPVEIEPWDIVDGTLNVSEIDSRSIVNKVTVNCGHSYGRNAPLGSVTYDHPLSQAYWGASQERIVDEPWIHVKDLVTGAPQAATYLARYFGSVQARPRLTVTVGLAQKFYDLRPGHLLQFSRNMETAGIHCPAYRTGRIDYAYPATTAANQADDTTPTLVSGGSVDRSPAWGMSQQTDSATFHVSTPGAYTAHANPWQYDDGTGTLTDLTGLSCSDGGAASTLFTRSGEITLSFTRPTITSWGKGERTYQSASRGPCYWLIHNATTVTTAALGDAISTIPARWWGRLFIVRETNRRVGSTGYPYMEAVMQEVM